MKAFELKQSLPIKREAADYIVKRRILEILCLNFVLNDATLLPTMRKPFDVLAEGLLSGNSRDDKTAIELFVAGIRGWEAGLRRQLDAAKSKQD